MELLKKYGYIILIIIAVTLLVILRSTGTGHFRYDAKKWAKPSLSGSNIVTPASVSLLKGEKFIIYLGSGQARIAGFDGKEMTIPADSILTKKYSSVLDNSKRVYILCSPEYAVSSKVWMVLAQAGFKNVYIYSADPDIEVLKKEIRPDTVRPD